MLGKDYNTFEDDSEDAEVVTKYKKGEYEYEEGQEDREIEEDLNILDLIDHKNIAELLSEDTLKQIAEDVIEGYDLDKVSRSTRENAMQRAMNMALHITKVKNTPWPNASNVIFPIISNAGISFAARAYPALVRDDKVVMGKVIGSDAGQPQPVIDPMTGMPPVDPQTGQPVIDPMTNQPPIQMVGAGEKHKRADRVAEYMNYQFSEEMDEWEEDTDRMLHALPVTGNMFRKVWWDYEEERIKSELIWPTHLIVNNNASGLKRASRISEEKEYYPYEIAEFIRCGLWLDFTFGQGGAEQKEADSERDKDTEKTDSQAQHFFIEQCLRLDLDNDGYPEPYIALVHKETSQVVRLVANYQKDGIKFNRKKEIKRIVPEVYYIKYGFIPSPDGSFYDIGFGELLLHSSEMINSLINQLIDAGTLSNTSHGFIGDGLKIKGGKVEVTKGTFTKVDSRGMSIKDNLVQIQHPEPSQTLFQLLGLLIESAKDLGSLKEVLSGEQMANQAGITTLTLIEQGLTAFKSIYKRIARSVKNEVKIVYRLNSLYLHDEAYRNVMDSQVEISRKDFDDKGIDILPSSAPHMVSDMQRLARAQFLETYREDPYAKGLELRQRIFEMAGIDDADELLQDAPPPPEDPNIAFVKGQIEVEQFKAQIKQQEAMQKAQEQAANLQLKQQEFNLKTQIEAQKAQNQALQNQIKLQEQEAKVRLLSVEGSLAHELHQQELKIKTAKTEAEIIKLEAQTQELQGKINIDRQSAQSTQLDLFVKEQKVQQTIDAKLKEETDNNDIQEIKETLKVVIENKDVAIKEIIKPLLTAISNIEANTEMKANAHDSGMEQMMRQIADTNDAIESLKAMKEVPAQVVEKECSGTKRFIAKRNKDGSLEGQIITEDSDCDDKSTKRFIAKRNKDGSLEGEIITEEEDGISE